MFFFISSRRIPKIALLNTSQPLTSSYLPTYHAKKLTMYSMVRIVTYQPLSYINVGKKEPE